MVERVRACGGGAVSVLDWGAAWLSILRDPPRTPVAALTYILVVTQHLRVMVSRIRFCPILCDGNHFGPLERFFGKQLKEFFGLAFRGHQRHGVRVLSESLTGSFLASNLGSARWSTEYLETCSKDMANEAIVRSDIWVRVLMGPVDSLALLPAAYWTCWLLDGEALVRCHVVFS